MPVIEYNGKKIQVPEGTSDSELEEIFADIDGASGAALKPQPFPEPAGGKKAKLALQTAGGWVANAAGLPGDIAGLVGAGVDALAARAAAGVSAATSPERTYSGELKKAKADLASKPNLPTMIGDVLGSDAIRGAATETAKAAGYEFASPKTKTGAFAKKVLENMSYKGIFKGAASIPKLLAKGTGEAAQTAAAIAAGDAAAEATQGNPLASALAAMAAGTGVRAGTTAVNAGIDAAGSAAGRVLSTKAAMSQAEDQVAAQVQRLLGDQKTGVVDELKAKLLENQQQNLPNPDTASLTADPVLSALGEAFRTRGGASPGASSSSAAFDAQNKRANYEQALVARKQQVLDSTAPVENLKSAAEIQLSRLTSSARKALEQAEAEKTNFESAQSKIDQAAQEQSLKERLTPIEAKLEENKLAMGEASNRATSAADQLAKIEQRNMVRGEGEAKVQELTTKKKDIESTPLPLDDRYNLKGAQGERSAQLISDLRAAKKKEQAVVSEKYDAIPEYKIPAEEFSGIADTLGESLRPDQQKGLVGNPLYKKLYVDLQNIVEAGGLDVRNIPEYRRIASDALGKLDSMGDYAVTDADRALLKEYNFKLQTLMESAPGAVGKAAKEANAYYSKVYGPLFRDVSLKRLIDKPDTDEFRFVDKVAGNQKATEEALAQINKAGSPETISLLRDAYVANNIDKLTTSGTLDEDKVRRFMASNRQYIDTVPGLSDNFQEILGEAAQISAYKADLRNQASAVENEIATVKKSLSDTLRQMQEANAADNLQRVQELEGIRSARVRLLDEYNKEKAAIQKELAEGKAERQLRGESLAQQVEKFKASYQIAKDAAKNDPLVRAGLDVAEQRRFIQAGDITPADIRKLRDSLPKAGAARAFDGYKRLYLDAVFGSKDATSAAEFVANPNRYATILASHRDNLAELFGKDSPEYRSLKLIHERLEGLSNKGIRLSVDSPDMAKQIGNLVEGMLVVPSGAFTAGRVGTVVRRVLRTFGSQEQQAEVWRKMMMDPDFAVLLLQKNVNTDTIEKRMKSWLAEQTFKTAIIGQREAQEEQNGTDN